MKIEQFLGQPNVNITVTPADLQEFALSIVEKMMGELSMASANKVEQYLTPDETAAKLGVSKNSLWRWNKIGYLRHVKVGRKSLYLLSEVEKLLRGDDK